MPRIAPLPASVLDDSHAQLLDKLNVLLGFECNDWLTLAHVPPLMASAMSLCSSAIDAAEDCGEDLRWLVCFASSRAFGCQYCVAHSAYTATRLGVPEAKLLDIDRYETSAAYSEPERAGIRVAIGMGTCPTTVKDADFDELRKYFSESQIVALCGLSSMMGFFNRWNDAMATELETPPKENAALILSSTGWSAGKHKQDR